MSIFVCNSFHRAYLILHCILEDQGIIQWSLTHNLVMVSSVVSESMAVSYRMVAMSVSVSMTIMVSVVNGDGVYNWLHVFNNWLHDWNMFHDWNHVVVGSVLVLVRSGNWNLCDVHYWCNWNMSNVSVSVVSITVMDSCGRNCQKSGENSKHGFHVDC